MITYNDLTGRISSFQSLGAVDGPGLRYVVFMQGCPLRCKCCHNPETWEVSGGTEYTVKSVLKRVQGCRNFFGSDGGITVSGGEPLLQKDFVCELFKACHNAGIRTALDTSGCITDGVDELLSYTDLCLLDYKMTNAEDYKRYTGCDIKKPQKFMKKLEEHKIPTWVRQVIIPGINDNKESVHKLNEFAKANPYTEKVELLPFKKMCEVKYKELGIPFGFAEMREATVEDIQRLQE